MYVGWGSSLIEICTTAAHHIALLLLKSPPLPPKMLSFSPVACASTLSDVSDNEYSRLVVLCVSAVSPSLPFGTVVLFVLLRVHGEKD